MQNLVPSRKRKKLLRRFFRDTVFADLPLEKGTDTRTDHVLRKFQVEWGPYDPPRL